MGLQIEQLKNRAKEYAKAYHEKEVKRGVHKGEMEKILRQACLLYTSPSPRDCS